MPFSGINSAGQVARLTRTRGNPLGRLVLRGGAVPDYDSGGSGPGDGGTAGGGPAANVVVDLQPWQFARKTMRCKPWCCVMW
jgi:3-deoxy-7-phosphoheptulonate synthase